MIQISGPSKLFLNDEHVAAVKCNFRESESGDLRGTVIHEEGHPYWNPILGVHPQGPYRLIMSDGHKFNVTFENLLGDVRVEAQ